MKQQVVFVISLSAMVLSAHWVSRPTVLSGAPETPDHAPALQRDTENKSGFRAYIDPEMREFTVAPPVFVETAPSSHTFEDALNHSTEGLEERPSDVEGGGIMVDLQGRFRNTSVATINSDGTVSAPCLPIRPDAAAADRNNTEERTPEGGEDR